MLDRPSPGTGYLALLFGLIAGTGATFVVLALELRGAGRLEQIAAVVRFFIPLGVLSWSPARGSPNALRALGPYASSQVGLRRQGRDPLRQRGNRRACRHHPARPRLGRWARPRESPHRRSPHHAGVGSDLLHQPLGPPGVRRQHPRKRIEAARRSVEADDHVLVIGCVLDGEVLVSAEPLTSLCTGWTYSG